MNICAIPGSFDPVTEGHADIIRRAAALFDKAIVGVLCNSAKRYTFTEEQRLDFLRLSLADFANVEVMPFNGLTAEFARAVGAKAIIKGVRIVGDFEAEMQMATLNRGLSGIETVLLPADSKHLFLSSTMVRDIGQHGGNIEGLVPQGAYSAILKAFREAAK